MSKYQIPCGRVGFLPGLKTQQCRDGNLCPTCQVVKELKVAAWHALTMLEGVRQDEETVKAGLWQGPAIPRAIEMLENALSRVEVKT